MIQMPCEIHTVSLKPNDFFTVSPSIDVPTSTQAFNQSKLVNGDQPGTHMQGSNKVEVEAKENGLNSKGCCA